jgi:hypothetical protein
VRLALAFVAQGFLKNARLTFCHPCRAGHPVSRPFADRGLVDGRVGSDLSTSSAQSGSPLGLTRAYQRPPEPGPRAGSSGMVMPGQVVPEEVPVFVRPDGSGAAFVAGQRVIVSPNSNRIMRVVQ